MMRMIFIAAALLAAGSASAKECHRYTHESRAPGETVAEIDDDRVLTVTDQYAGKSVYDLATAGTGIPFFVGTARKGSVEKEDVQVMEHKGDLILDMMVFVPYCRK